MIESCSPVSDCRCILMNLCLKTKSWIGNLWMDVGTWKNIDLETVSVANFAPPEMLPATDDNDDGDAPNVAEEKDEAGRRALRKSSASVHVEVRFSNIAKSLYVRGLDATRLSRLLGRIRGHFHLPSASLLFFDRRAEYWGLIDEDAALKGALRSAHKYFSNLRGKVRGDVCESPSVSLTTHDRGRGIYHQLSAQDEKERLEDYLSRCHAHVGVCLAGVVLKCIVNVCLCMLFVLCLLSVISTFV